VNYHRGDLVTISPEDFEAQLRYLSLKGYTLLSTDEFVAYLKGERKAQERAVLLAFDDGYLDTWVYNFGGLTWDEIKEMEISGIMDVQSHSHFHKPFSHKGEEGRREKLVEDLRTSKKLIEERLEKRCLYLCWPWGDYDREILQWARHEGYEAFFTTERGINTRASNIMAIKRIDVKKGDVAWFASRLFIYSHPLLGHIYSRIRGKL